MFSALMRSKIASLLLMFKGKDGKRSVFKTIMMIFVLLYTGGTFFFLFYNMFSALLPASAESGVTWLPFSLYVMLCFSVMFMMSIFITKSQLFEAKDNELLLSMPIPVGYIIASRLLFVYVINTVTELFVFIPLAVSVIKTGVSLSPLGWIAMILFALALPFFATAVASVFGSLLALITKRMRNKSAVTVIFSIAALAAYMYYFPRIMDISAENVMGAEGLFRNFPPIYWFGNAIGSGNILHFVLALLVQVIPFVIAFIIIEAVFKNVISSSAGQKRIVYKERELKTSTPVAALLRREFIRLGKTPMYLLNDGMGIIVMIFACIAICFIPREGLTEFLNSMPKGFTSAAVTLSGCAILSTVLFTSATISLEGKTLWQLQSFPVSAKGIVQSKLLMHNIIAQPVVLVFAAVFSIVLKVNVLWAFVSYVTMACFCFIISLAGILIDLKWPMLKWENETMAVKQNAGIILDMLIGFTLIGVPVLIVIFLVKNPDFYVINLCYLGALCMIAAGLYTLLMKTCERSLQKL